jgi:hypothetical protein
VQQPTARRPVAPLASVKTVDERVLPREYGRLLFGDTELCKALPEAFNQHGLLIPLPAPELGLLGRIRVRTRCAVGPGARGEAVGDAADELRASEVRGEW